MSRKAMSVIALVLLATVCAWAADALTCSGKPNFAALESKGYFLWRDKGGWHLRWVTKGQKRQFSGTIACDAPFTACEGTDQGPTDAVVLAAAGLIRFDSHSSGGVKGLDFDVDSRATKLSFNLQMDGEAVPADLVRMGYRGNRPEAVPFVIQPLTR